MCAISGEFLQGAPYEQNQHFKKLRHKVSIYTQQILLLRGLPSLDAKHKVLITKKRKKVSQAWVTGQTDYKAYNIQLGKIS